MEKNRNKGIINLVVVMSIGLFALGTAYAIAAVVAGELAKNKNSISGDRVFYAAESALEEGTLQYLEDDAFSIGEGELINNISDADMEVIELDWPYVKVKGLAENSITNRAAVYMITKFPEGLAFDHAIYAQDFLTIGGSAEIWGSVFANNGIDFTGNSADVNGNAYSAGNIPDIDNINGDVYENVTPIPLPDFDSEPYKLEAEAGGTSFATATDAEDYLKNETRNAVIFVQDEDGEETKIQDTDLTGSLVVLGDLELTGGLYAASENHLAIAVFGNLRIAGGTTVNGAVYVTGDTSFGSGNNSITGAFLCGGQTVVTGNTTIVYDPELAQSWQDLEGLNLTSSESPRVILWQEE